MFHEVSVYPKKELPFFILFTAGLCSFTAMLALLTHQFPELMGVFAKAVSVTHLSTPHKHTTLKGCSFPSAQIQYHQLWWRMVWMALICRVWPNMTFFDNSSCSYLYLKCKFITWWKYDRVYLNHCVTLQIFNYFPHVFIETSMSFLIKYNQLDLKKKEFKEKVAHLTPLPPILFNCETVFQKWIGYKMHRLKIIRRNQ